MTLRDAAEHNAAHAEAATVMARLESERKKHAATRRELVKANDRVAELEKLLERFTAVKPGDTKVPRWLKPKAKGGDHRATALLVLSDLHLDEVVDLDEMSGMNAYNRSIAERRLETVVNGAVRMCHDYVAGVTFDGIVAPLNGDILTGEIHDELARTNEAPSMSSVTHWVPKLASAIRYLADEFGHVFVPCTDGNHDRFYKRTPAKKRAESSLAWVVYNWLADMLRDDERITFRITTAPGQTYPIYSTVIHQIHGDGFRSGGGVGGIYPAMLKYLHRMDKMWQDHGVNVDLHVMGHWHTYLSGPNYLVNGSLVGYSEYARQHGFAPEPPRQALAIVTPERGVTMNMPVYAD